MTGSFGFLREEITGGRSKKGTSRKDTAAERGTPCGRCRRRFCPDKGSRYRRVTRRYVRGTPLSCELWFTLPRRVTTGCGGLERAGILRPGTSHLSWLIKEPLVEVSGETLSVRLSCG